MELLQWYLVSIGVYFVTCLVLLDLFADRIMENGWLDDFEVDDFCDNPYPELFLKCAIPIVRVGQCAAILTMAFHTREEIEDE